MTTAIKKITVKFIDVGRGKKSWEAEIPVGRFHTAMRASIKKQKALGSNGIEIEFDEGTGTGDIYVGGFRKVGHFEVVKS
jgi:hypothetical protein